MPLGEAAPARGRRGQDSGRRRRRTPDHPVGLSLGRALVLRSPDRPQRHGSLRLCGDRQARVHAEVRRDGCAVHDVQARIAPDAVVWVDDAAVGRAGDHRTAEEVRCHRDVEDLADAGSREGPLAGGPLEPARQSPHRGVALGDVGRVGRTVALARGEARAEEATSASDVDGVVGRLHDERNDGALAPPAFGQGPEEDGRVGHGLTQELRPSGNRPPPSTCRMASRPMALEPLP